MRENEVKLIISADAARAENVIGSFYNKAKSAFGGIQTIVGSMAAGYIFDKLIMGTARFGEEMKRMSQVAGISVEHISALKYAAEQSETSFEDLANGIKFMSKNMDDLKKVGLVSMNTKDSYEALLQLADQFFRMPEGAAKSALALEYFGRSGTQILPFLNEGKEGINKLTAEAERLGIVLSTDAANAADKFNDQLKELSATAKGVSITIGKPMIETFNAIANSMKGLGTMTAEKGFLKGLWSWATSGKDEMRNYLEKMKVIPSSAKTSGKGTILDPSKFMKDSKKAGDDIARLLGDWGNKLDALNPSLSESDKEILKWTDDFIKLRDALAEKGIKDFSKQSEDLMKAVDIIYDTAAKKNAFEKLEKDVGKTSKAIKEQVEGLKSWRDALASGYDTAISKMDAARAKAEAYRSGAGEIGAWLAGLTAGPKTFESESARMKELLSSSWQIEDQSKLMDIFNQVKGFVEENRGQKDFLGFGFDFGDMTQGVKDLQWHMENLGDQADQEGNQIAKWANKQIDAIESVDSWMKYLDTDIETLNSSLASTKEMKIDTSAAQASISALTTQVIYLQSLLGGGTSVPSEVPNANIPLPNANIPLPNQVAG